jgi:hypothetical protein
MRARAGASLWHRRVGEAIGDGFRITGMVEKPAKGTQPSNFFINGRYILQPEIFKILETQERGAGNEIQLTDGMLKLLKEQDFTGYHYKGATYDTAPRMASSWPMSPSRSNAPISDLRWWTACRADLKALLPSRRSGLAVGKWHNRAARRF